VYIPYKSLHRVDLLLRGKTIDALRRSGSQIVWVGAESGSQKILDAMEKGTKIEQIYEATRQMHAAGLKVGFFLQFGYPGETRQDIEKTLEMVRDCRPDDIGMSVSYPLPGTKFFENVRLQLGLKQNWYDSQDMAMMYQGPFTTSFYRKLHTVIHKEFRMRKAWTELKHVITERARLNRQHVRMAVSMVYQWSSLPIARLELNRLAKLKHQGISNAGTTLSPEEAARPTPQAE